MVCKKCDSRKKDNKIFADVLKDAMEALFLCAMFVLSVFMSISTWNNLVPRGTFGIVLFAWTVVVTSMFASLYWESVRGLND